MDEKAKALTLEQIATADDCELLEVEVPEWGGSIYFRVLPADVGLKLSDRAAALEGDDRPEAMFFMLARCLSDEEGRPFVTTDEQEAIAVRKLKTRSQKVLLRIQKLNVALQGWDDDTKGAAGKGADAA